MALYELTEKKMEALSKVPKYIEEGKKYIYPQRFDEWSKSVDGFVRFNIYFGKNVEISLSLMKLLDEGSTV